MQSSLKVFGLLLMTVTSVARLSAQQADSVAIVGEWRLIGGEMRGDAIPPTRLQSLVLKIEKGGLWTDSEGGTAKWSIDVTKTPRALDLVHTTGPDKDGKQHGIYRLSGDSLTMVLGIPGAGETRPTEFVTTRDAPVLLFVFGRVKKEGS